MLKDVSGFNLKPASFLARALTRAKNYSNVIGWLLYSSVKERPFTVIGAILLSGFHFVCQVGGIYAIYWLAKLMETNGTVSLPRLGISFAARSEPELLWVMLVFSTLCFLASASCLFFSRRMILQLQAQRHAKNLETLVTNIARLPDPRAPIASSILITYRWQRLQVGSRFALQTNIFFFNAISSALGGLGALLFLFRLNAPLTLLILLATTLGAGLLYPLTLRASRLALEREKLQQAHQEEMRRRVGSRAKVDSSTLSTAEGSARAQLSNWLVNAEQTFAIDVGKTLILGLVGFYLATQILAGRENWAILIAYLGALRLTLVGFSQAIRAYASVSRYYPQLNRYYLFQKDVQRIDSASLGKAGPGASLILGMLPDGTVIRAKTGERIALLTGDPPPEIRFALLHAELTHSQASLGTAFVGSDPETVAQAAVLLVDADLLAEGATGEQPSSFDDKLLLVVYRDGIGIGACGEKQLLICQQGELRRFESLGTPESDSAIAQFARRARRQNRGVEADEGEEEEDEVEESI